MTAHLSASDFGSAFPGSRKVAVPAGTPERPLAVPMREIALSGGEPPLRVYDTSGPQGFDVREGLPPVRGEWIAARAVTSHESRVASHPERSEGSLRLIPDTLRRPLLRGNAPVTQLHYARRGEITPEMEFVALREGLSADFVRSEVAR